MSTVVVIPAYNPDKRLCELTDELINKYGCDVVAVDDGSRPECRDVFDRLEKSGCTVCRHIKNMGKGRALKTGIRRAAESFPGLSGVVTADADGQHLPRDIMRLAGALAGSPESLILGARDFSSPQVPPRSRLGNRITSFIFRRITGVGCSDTQTGLRAIPAHHIAFCLSVPGERYEYETNLLISAAKKGIPFKTIPIETVYLEKNRSSHFNPVLDSARIYYHIFRNAARFGLSSLISAAADLSFFTLFSRFLFRSAAAGRTADGILYATAAARCVSGALNFTLNKLWSFEASGDNFGQALKYFILFCVQMLLSWLFVTLFSFVDADLTVIKLFIDTALFIISYFIQRNFIFKP